MSRKRGLIIIRREHLNIFFVSSTTMFSSGSFSSGGTFYTIFRYTHHMGAWHMAWGALIQMGVVIKAITGDLTLTS